MSPLPQSGLLLRVLTALIVLPVLLALIWAPGLQWGLVAFVAAIVAVGAHEYLEIARKCGLKPRSYQLQAGAILIVLSAGFGELLYINIALTAVISAAALEHVARPPTSAGSILATGFGFAYLGWFPAHLILTHALEPHGPGAVTILLVVVALTDTGAYFIGKAIGRRPLAPVVSPKKTWEGAIGGFVCAVLSMIAVYALRRQFAWEALPDWSLYRYAAAGAVVSVVAQVGDLLASSFKREAGVKDSGVLFPGHGGALDRCDGFLFGAPVLYYMAVF